MTEEIKDEAEACGVYYPRETPIVGQTVRLCWDTNDYYSSPPGLTGTQQAIVTWVREDGQMFSIQHMDLLPDHPCYQRSIYWDLRGDWCYPYPTPSHPKGELIYHPQLGKFQ